MKERYELMIDGTRRLYVQCPECDCWVSKRSFKNNTHSNCNTVWCSRCNRHLSKEDYGDSPLYCKDCISKRRNEK